MRRTNRGIAAGWALLGATLTVGAAAVMSIAGPQDPPAAPPAGGGPRGGGGFGGGFGAGGFGGPTVMTANERFVFVLRGNTLYKLDVNSLSVLAQTQLPAAAGGGRMGGGRGGAGGGDLGGAGAGGGAATP